jgi:starch-binding outer membrane protein, SusD/RagB family
MKLNHKFMFHRYHKPVLGFGIVTLLVFISSCKKFVEIDPPKTQLVGSEVFTSDATALSAVGSMYSKMIAGGILSFTDTYITIFAGQSADEFKNFGSSQGYLEFYQNALTPQNSTVTGMWNNAYAIIYSANAIIEGLEASTNVSPALKTQYTAEAKFIRAWCHFYLLNLHGDVPYITTTDYRANALASRMPKAELYQKLIDDLQTAEAVLADNFSYSNNERTRANKSAAAALLARLYLYKGDWVNAEAKATAVISKSSVYSLVSNLNNVFLKNSTEAIWQTWQSGASSWNTFEGRILIATSTSVPGYDVSLSSQMLGAFETGDNRRTSWVGNATVAGQTYYFPYKYKVKSGSTVTEYYMMLRLAEQYLIRAEARAQQNNLTGAIADLNVIRARAGLPALLTTLTQAQVMTALKQERRIELFCEHGHRWLDLKRMGDVDAVMGPIKSGWSSTDALYPIPQTQMLNDPNMTQNPGY